MCKSSPSYLILWRRDRVYALISNKGRFNIETNSIRTAILFPYRQLPKEGYKTCNNKISSAELIGKFFSNRALRRLAAATTVPTHKQKKENGTLPNLLHSMNIRTHSQHLHTLEPPIRPHAAIRPTRAFKETLAKPLELLEPSFKIMYQH